MIETAVSPITTVAPTSTSTQKTVSTSSTTGLPSVKVFSEAPGSSFTGLVPAYFTHIGKMENETIVACFKLLNSISLKSVTLSTLIKEGRLSCISYDKGIMKSISVYHTFVDSFVKKGASDIILSFGGDEYALVKGKEKVDITKMEKESYNKMSRVFLPLLKA